MSHSLRSFRSARTLASGLIGALVLGLVTPAYAEPAPAPVAPTPSKREPTAGDFATARAALREGLLLREKGSLPEALTRLASAYDLVPTPVTGFELGKTHMMLGHVLTAHELFKKVVRMPPSMEESTRSETARDEAARLAKEIEPRIPSLRLTLRLAPGASAVVRVDEEVITMSGTETVRAVDPGPHDIVAKAGDGPEEKVRIEVAETEMKEVILAPTWVAPKVPPPAGKSTQIIYVRTTNPLAFVGFGVAAAAVVVSGITAVVALDSYNEALDRCGNDYCPPTQRQFGSGANSSVVGDQPFTDAAGTSAATGIVSLVAGVTAIVFVGVGIVGIMRPVRERVVSEVPPPKASSVRFAPFGLKGAGLGGTF